MNSRGRATIGLLACSLAAAGAGLRAGVLLGGGHAPTRSPADVDAAVAATRARLGAALTERTRGLEAEVARAAQVPELRAALTDRVDGATIVDLFETEDWWTPYRARDAAIIAGGNLLAVHGDKELPVPVGLSSRTPDSIASSGLLVGARPVVAAVVPIALTRRTEPTSLMLATPFDTAAFAREIGAPVALSDGHRVIAAAGDQAAALFATVPGQEVAGRHLTGEGGALAVAVPASASVWLWTLAAMPPPVAAGHRGNPRVWLGLMALFGLSGLFFWRGRARAAPPAAEPAPDEQAVPDEPAVNRNSVVHIGSGDRPPEEERRSTTKMGTPRTPTTDPSVFGRYRLLRRLDGGGMADIYTAALHGAEGFRRVFVIKRLRPELARNKGAVDQFIDEAKLGSTLAHPNIVPVFDFGKVGDEYFMAQEFIIGRDISRLLERHRERIGKPLGEKLMIYVAHDVLEALAYAHSQPDASGAPLGLVHRDISPGNIMVTARGEVKLFDFGIVKATGRVSKTEAGVVKGNVGFMSPEQARGQPVDQRSDLFSLGLVMYYALTDELIYSGDGAFEQLLQAATGPSPGKLASVAHLPLVSGVLQRVLAVDPAQRYQSAVEFAATLAPHVAGSKGEAAALMQRLFGDELRAPTDG